MRLFARGLSDKQVARQLAISDLTVRKHRSNMQGKLGVSNSCALLFEAVASGWLVLPLADNPSETLDEEGITP